MSFQFLISILVFPHEDGVGRDAGHDDGSLFVQKTVFGFYFHDTSLDVGMADEGQAGRGDTCIARLDALFDGCIAGLALDVRLERDAVERLRAHEPNEAQHARHGRYAQRREASGQSHVGEGVIVVIEIASTGQDARNADARQDEKFYQEEDDGYDEQDGDDGDFHNGK